MHSLKIFFPFEFLCDDEGLRKSAKEEDAKRRPIIYYATTHH